MSSEILHLKEPADLSGGQSVIPPDRERQSILGGIKGFTRRTSRWFNETSFTPNTTQLSSAELSRIAQVREGILKEVLQVKVDSKIIDLPPEPTESHL